MNGGVAWDIDNWPFLPNGKEYDSINPSLHLSISPSLQRQATLNMEYGLFEVVPGIYLPPVNIASSFVFVKRTRLSSINQYLELDEDLLVS
jgi:alkyl sulfatase BDS1-like metallo-beta-lactamase superfamily hydrolase